MNEMIALNNGITAQAETVGEMAAMTREQTEIQSAIISAKRFPRNEHAAFSKSVKSFTRLSMADAATYNFPRGGKSIEGPSIDCARELARCWGNIRYGLRIVAQTDDRVHIRGYALDLETNSYVEAEDEFSKLIQRKVDSPQGRITKWVQPDERDLRELINRRGAIVVRNCILQILPPDLVDDVVATAKQTLKKQANQELNTNREDVVKRLVVAFDRIGVSVEMLEGYMKHKLDVINDDEVVNLKQVLQTIREGHSKREDYFTTPEAHGAPETQSVTESIKAKLKSKQSTETAQS